MKTLVRKIGFVIGVVEASFIIIFNRFKAIFQSNSK